tara:strand:+ start:1538 stop:2377 length:840 start_codon:yes stop_codon:yes gene_type:complete
MEILKKVLLLSLFFVLSSCGADKEKVSVVKEKDIELQMIDAFKEGYEALEDGDVFFAAKKFNEAELLYPQSVWAPKASLMAAYAWYSQNYYYDAVFELNRFIETYPNDKNIPYAHFLLGMCYYENIIDERKDLEPLIRAKKKFEFIIEEYPDTDFALDATFKIGLIEDIMAAKEMYIGRHYIKKGKWIPAINRFKIVLKDYGTTIFVEEALHRLVEIHYKIGLTEEANKYASLLGYNYQSSKWYEESYRVFNKNYQVKIKNKKKKSKNFIIRKFKSLFD